MILLGFTEKSRFKEGVTRKQYIGGLPKKGGSWTVCRFKWEELAKKEGG